jgi:hypothetical protein
VPEVAQKMLKALSKGRLVEVRATTPTINADNAAEFNVVTAAFLQE